MTLKPAQWAVIILGLGILSFVLHSHLQDFGDTSFLGGLLMLEVIVAAIWKFSSRFFVLLMIVFLWAGMNVPLAGVFTSGRWLVLAAGALAGYAIWMKSPGSHFKLFHLVSLFCVGAAFVSATVSQYVQMASLKALSLLLLFLYCSSGARAGVLGREERFFHGLLLAAEIAVYLTAACYLGLGLSIWGNPNSLGAVISIGLFPLLLWGWLTSDGGASRLRRLLAVLLCVYTALFSMARASLISIVLVTLIFCICLHQQKLLVKIFVIFLFIVAVVGMWAPATLSEVTGNLKDAVLYKGHKDAGPLGSRKTPWEETISSIKEHPWFGTGYGTSPSGEDPGLDFGRFASSAETEREHGSSYMTIAEWVGLLGVLPFVWILSLTALNVWRVCLWMNRTANARHYSIPLAMIVLSGLLHATFEDWLFAVGAYPSVFFWVMAFLLADLVPQSAEAPAAAFAARFSPVPNRFGAIVSNR
jgi:O-antigen ligase